jgi:beta-galactosidase beta subunit
MHWIGTPLTIILIKNFIAEGVFKNIQKTKYGLKSDSIYVIEHTYNAHLVREKKTSRSNK